MYFARVVARGIYVYSLTGVVATAVASVRNCGGFHHHHQLAAAGSTRIALRLFQQLLLTETNTSCFRGIAALTPPPTATRSFSTLGGRASSVAFSVRPRQTQFFLSMSTDPSTTSPTMVPNVAANVQEVQNRVNAAAAAVAQPNQVRLVAVSKTKPMTLLDAAYDAGCRYFGENYVQELVEKTQAWNDRRDVQWHFIGALQSNKCKQLVQTCADDVSRLTVETVASTKLASKLNQAVQNLREGREKQQQRLKVFVQVNTSGEDSKSGVEPGSLCVELCRYIVRECPALELRGLMTIGAIGDVSCFAMLKDCRDEALTALDGLLPELELSMGMSDDFEQAIQAGATNVRVGSTIFGARDYSDKT